MMVKRLQGFIPFRGIAGRKLLDYKQRNVILSI
jgi:hypothetical protein